MKERGKGLEVYGDDQNLFQGYSFSSDLPCKKHPQSTSVGICPFCLRDRLVKLVCSDCGEQRLSSCSCSDELSSNPRTSGAGDVGSVGRVSFLIENENKDQLLVPGRSSKPKSRNCEQSEEVFFLKRSSSSCVEIKRKNGFWRIGRFFRKRKDQKDCGKSVRGVDEKSDLWVVDHVGHVSRSRSLCSFRGNGPFGSEDGGDLMSFSGARSSISAARSSSVNGGLGFDPGRRSGFSEAEPRKSGFSEAEPRRSGCSERRDSTFMESDVETRGGFNNNNNNNRKVFSLKENFLSGGDEPGFIDLKFEFPSEAKSDMKGNYNGGFDPLSAFGSMRENEFGAPMEGIYGGGYMESGIGRDGRFGSCRITVNERGIKKSRKSFKGWRWIFSHHQSGSSLRKKDDLNCESQMKA